MTITLTLNYNVNVTSDSLSVVDPELVNEPDYVVPEDAPPDPREKNYINPSVKYHPSMCELAHGLALLGYDRQTIASRMGMHAGQLRRLCRQHRELGDAIRSGGTVADIKVTKSLYERACGLAIETPDGKVYKVPPDVTACIFWLKNRQREHWRDKVEHTVYTGGNANILEAKRDDLVRELQKRGRLTIDNGDAEPADATEAA